MQNKTSKTDTQNAAVIFTIGHSTSSLEKFIALLKTYSVTTVVDIRTIPRSRHNPQFNKDSLEDSLKRTGLGYLHREGLGGLRPAKKDSVNKGWQNVSFRGFADYMQTAAFEQSIKDLIQFAKNKQIVLMCAEAIPSHCHRSLIADALMVRGIIVKDIISLTHLQEHKLTPFAHVEGTIITYPEVANSETTAQGKHD